MRKHRIPLQGETRSKKILQLWGNLKSIYGLNERKFGLWLKKEVPCIIMFSRATGRRLLVARARELPQIRANQDRSLEMSPT